MSDGATIAFLWGRGGTWKMGGRVISKKKQGQDEKFVLKSCDKLIQKKAGTIQWK